MRAIKPPVFLAFLLFLSAAGYVSAQPAPLEFSWEDCVREALAGNPALKAKKLAVEQYKYLLLAGYNAYLPRVSLSHSVNRSGGDNTSPATRWGVSVSATEPIIDLSAMSSIRVSRINYEKVLSDYRGESAALRQSLYSAFMNLLVAQEQVKVDRKILGIREQNARLIQLKYESGMESKGNAMYAAALHELSMAEAQKSERALNMSRRELLKNMGVSTFRPITAKGELKVPEYDFKAENAKEALERVPQVVSLEKSAEGYKERLLSSQYGLFPTLNASQSVSWSGPVELPGNRSWSLGLSLNLPLFSNGVTYYANNTRAARLALQSAEESLKDLKISLENGILSGYDDFLNTRDTAVSNANVLAANEERYKESQIKYMAGKISFIDLANVEQSMVDAQQNQLQYLRNANNKKIFLENLLGVGLED